MTAAVIYALVDPRSGSIRYVGKAANVGLRLWQHLADARKGDKTYRSIWIRSLAKVGVTPVLAKLYSVPEGVEWKDAERFFIASARFFGMRLTNGTDGGDGGPLPKCRQRISTSTRATWSDPVVRARRVAAMKAYFDDPETRKQRSVFFSKPEIRAARAVVMRSSEHRNQKRITALKPEVRAKKSIAMLRLFADPEWKMKNVEARKKARLSPGNSNQLLLEI